MCSSGRLLRPLTVGFADLADLCVEFDREIKLYLRGDGKLPRELSCDPDATDTIVDCWTLEQLLCRDGERRSAATAPSSESLREFTDVRSKGLTYRPTDASLGRVSKLDERELVEEVCL